MTLRNPPDATKYIVSPTRRNISSRRLIVARRDARLSSLVHDRDSLAYHRVHPLFHVSLLAGAVW